MTNLKSQISNNPLPTARSPNTYALPYGQLFDQPSDFLSNRRSAFSARCNFNPR